MLLFKIFTSVIESSSVPLMSIAIASSSPTIYVMFKLVKSTLDSVTVIKLLKEVVATKVKLSKATFSEEIMNPILFNTALSPVIVTGLVIIT